MCMSRGAWRSLPVAPKEVLVPRLLVEHLDLLEVPGQAQAQAGRGLVGAGKQGRNLHNINSNKKIEQLSSN